MTRAGESRGDGNPARWFMAATAALGRVSTVLGGTEAKSVRLGGHSVGGGRAAPTLASQVCEPRHLPIMPNCNRAFSAMPPATGALGKGSGGAAGVAITWGRRRRGGDKRRRRCAALAADELAFDPAMPAAVPTQPQRRALSAPCAACAPPLPPSWSPRCLLQPRARADGGAGPGGIFGP